MILKGKQIDGRYDILQGPSSEEFYHCYQAFDNKDKKNVVIKFLKQEKVATKDESFFRYKNDLAFLLQVDHPALLKINSFGQWEENFYVVAESYQAPNLKEWLLSGKNTVKKSVEILIQLSDALAVLHAHGIIHKDLRPENILIDEQESGIKVKIAEFGLFNFIDLNQMIQDKKLAPMLFYIPPEQTRLIKRQIDNRSDLYSLGIIFYELLTGNPPFNEKEIAMFLYKHLAQKPEKPSSLAANTPPILDEIVLRLLNKEPDERYQTALGLKEDLEFFLKIPDNKSFEIGLKDRVETINFEIKMVGRAKELETLKNAYNKAFHGHPQMVLIQGESGVGKTKLVENFREEIKDEQFRFISFKCSVISKNIPFSAFVEIFKEYFSKIYQPEYQQEILDFNQEKLNTLHNLLPVIKTIFPIIKKPDEEISVEKRKREIFENLTRLFWSITRFKEKLVIFIDDIQHLDEDGLSLLDFLSENLRDCNLMFILSYTVSDPSHTLPQIIGKQSSLVTLLRIESLDQFTLKEMIKKIFNQKVCFSEENYSKIHQISFGNPLFIFQILKTLTDHRIFYYENEKWRIHSAEFENFEFKNDIYEMLLKRISSLSSEETEILSMASVFGKEFEIGQLKELFESVKGFNGLSRIIGVLEKAKSEQLIEENLLKGRGIFTFQHDKIQDILYHRIEDSEKKQMHLICAELLIAENPENVDKNIYYIAYHYNQTNHKKNFLYYNEMASQKSFSQHSIREAIYYMKNIVDFHLKNKILDQNLIAYILKMTKLSQTVGKIEESFEYLKNAIGIAQANEWAKEEIEINLQIGTGYYLRNEMMTALSFYEKAIEMAKNKNEEIKVSFPYTLAGSLYYFRSELEKAEVFFDKAIELIDDSDLENKVRTYGVRAWTLILMGKVNQGFEDIEVLESLIPKIENPMILSQIYHYCSICYSWSGKDPQKALSYSQISYRFADEFNYTLFLYSSLCSKAIAYFHQEKYDECLDNIRKAIEFSGRYKISIGITLMYGYQACALLWKREFEKANELSVQFLKEKEKIAEPFAVLMFLNAHSVYLYYNDELEEALLSVDEGIAIYEKTGVNLIGVSLLKLKAKILEDLRKPDDIKIITTRLETLAQERKGIDIFIQKASDLMEMISNARIERAKQKSIEKANAAFKDKIQLEKIIQVSQLFHSVINMDEILKTILEKTMEITGAQRGLLVLNTGKELRFDENLNDPNFQIPDQLLKEIMDTKKGVVWNSDILDEKQGNAIKSILCAPILLNDKICGYLYLDSFLLTNLFTARDLQVLAVFTTQIAWAIAMKKDIGLFQKENNETTAANPEKKEDLYEKYKITRREKEIVALVLQGFSNEEISKKIFVSLITVKIHIHNIYEKTSVKNRVELANLFSKSA